MDTIQIIIVEGSPLVRIGLACILNNIGGPVTIREITEKEKLAMFLKKDHDALMIISKSFIKQCDSRIIQQLQSKRKVTGMMLINDSDSLSKLNRKYDDIIEIFDTERIIINKISHFIQSLLTANVVKNDEISLREKDVLRLVALGMTNKEIGEKLYISTHTVISHRKNITSKLGIKTIAGLTVYAVINKIISPEEIK